MKGTFGMMVIATLVLGVVGPARSQSGSASGKSSGQVEGARATSSTGLAIEASADAKASAETIQDIKSRGAKLTGKALARTETRLDASVQKVNQWATRNEHDVAARLAGEFGSSVEALVGEKARYQCEWGELMLAHTLTANSKRNVTVEQVFDLHAGMAWSQIATGMGFQLNGVVAAARTEASVATGTTKADGAVATIHGEGAKAGVESKASVSASSAPARVGAAAGVQAGATVDTPPIKIK